MKPSWATLGIAASLFGLGIAFVGVDAVPVAIRSESVVALGWLSMTAVYFTIRAQFHAESHAAPTSVERGPRATVPEDDLDRVRGEPVAEYSPLFEDSADGFDQSYVATLVRAALQVERDVPAEEARERVERGTWTDDPVVAWFVSGGTVDRPTSSFPLDVRVRGAVDPDALDAYAIERTIDEIGRIRRGEP